MRTRLHLRCTLLVLLALATIRTAVAQAQWQPVASAPEDGVVCMTSLGNTLIAATSAIESGPVFLSTDSANTWTLCDSFPQIQNVTALFTYRGTLLAGTRPESTRPLVFRSADTGRTWKGVDSIGEYDQVDCFAADSQFVFAGAELNKRGAFLRSSDGGATWSELNVGHFGERIFSILIFAHTIFVGDWGSCIYSSTDEGLHWNIVQPLYATALASKDSLLFASTHDGFCVSSDTGKTWRTSTTGLISRNQGYAGALVVAGNDLFQTISASAPEVFRSTDNGSTWKYAADGINGWPSLEMLQVFGDYLITGAGWPYPALWRRPLADFGKPRLAVLQASIQSVELSNYPNPFSESTTIQFDLPTSGYVSLTLTDAAGREKVLIDHENMRA